ncbi:MAG: hypothetical protein PUD63_10035, partial [Clostridia bacterium]|nr:hypothetical protein [Clostridia bacterium]
GITLIQQLDGKTLIFNWKKIMEASNAILFPNSMWLKSCGNSEPLCQGLHAAFFCCTLSFSKSIPPGKDAWVEKRPLSHSFHQ